MTRRQAALFASIIILAVAILTPQTVLSMPPAVRAQMSGRVPPYYRPQMTIYDHNTDLRSLLGLVRTDMGLFGALLGLI